MAPEKLLGQEVDEVRCDIYGLGATLFEAVTLVRPLTVPEGLHRSCLPTYLAGIEPPRPGSIRPGFPAVLEAIIQKAMHRDPSLRYHSAAALADDLDGYLEVLAMPANHSGENSWAAGYAPVSWRWRSTSGQPACPPGWALPVVNAFGPLAPGVSPLFAAAGANYTSGHEP